MIAALDSGSRPCLVRIRMRRACRMLSQTPSLPPAKVVIDGLPLGILMGQHPPGTPTAQHVQNRIDNLASRDKRPAALQGWLWDQRLQHLPLRICQIGGIGSPPHRRLHTSSALYLSFCNSSNHPLSSYYRQGGRFQTLSQEPSHQRTRAVCMTFWMRRVIWWLAGRRTIVW